MTTAAATIYWVIVAIWTMVLCSVAYFYVRNPRGFGTIRLLLVVIAVDTTRNIVENIYFGLYFGSQYGLFPSSIVGVLGAPELLIVPKLLNVAAGCLVLGLLLYHWLPLAVQEWSRSEQRADDLRALAAIDPLTGLHNRRQFEALARIELARCQRYIRPMSLLMLDVDHFKDVNDQFGHAAGDDVLKMIAATLTSAKRDTDIVARIGGEEFAILLPETTKESARAVAERICELVRACSPVVRGEKLSLAVSIGIADATVRTAGIESLMRVADEVLYEAKRAGRDRVAVAKTNVEQPAIAAE